MRWDFGRLLFFLFFYLQNCNNKTEQDCLKLPSKVWMCLQPRDLFSPLCLFVCLCQFVSELRFDGFSLRRPLPLHSSFLQAATAAAAPSSTDQGRLSEVSPD